MGKPPLFVEKYSRAYRDEAQQIGKRYTALTCCAGFVMGISVTTCLLIMSAGSYAEMEE